MKGKAWLVFHLVIFRRPWALGVEGSVATRNGESPRNWTAVRSTRWKAAVRAQGKEGLRARPATGRPPRISPTQQKELEQHRNHFKEFQTKSAFIIEERC